MRARAGPIAAAAAADACCVLLFVAIGRHAHGHGDSTAGIWHTAWPFLAGLAIGLVAVRAWRRPLAIRPAGLGAWLGAAGAGMAIRVHCGGVYRGSRCVPGAFPARLACRADRQSALPPRPSRRFPGRLISRLSGRHTPNRVRCRPEAGSLLGREAGGEDTGRSRDSDHGGRSLDGC
jgi:hypothetical protein